MLVGNGNQGDIWEGSTGVSRVGSHGVGSHGEMGGWGGWVGVERGGSSWVVPWVLWYCFSTPWYFRETFLAAKVHEGTPP